MDTSSLSLINLLKAACHGRMRYGHAYCLCLCADWRNCTLRDECAESPGVKGERILKPVSGGVLTSWKSMSWIYTHWHTPLPAVARYLMANVQWSILDVYSRYSCSCFSFAAFVFFTMAACHFQVLPAETLHSVTCHDGAIVFLSCWFIGINQKAVKW